MDTLHQMRQLIALSDTGNYRKAGLRLGISHAAVSQTVRRLEIEYGFTLFEKQRGSTVPTAHGQRLLKVAKLLVTEAEQVKSEISAMKQLDGQKKMLV